MKHKNLLSGLKWPDRKRSYTLAALVGIVTLFLAFLSAIDTGSDEEGTAAAPEPAPAAAAPAAPAPAPMTARERYDYLNQAPDPQAAAPDPLPETAPEPAPEPVSAPAAAAPASEHLLCDHFPDTQSAEAQKAKLAFSGVRAEIRPDGDGYALAIGPFASREEGRDRFQKLAGSGLVSRCKFF